MLTLKLSYFSFMLLVDLSKHPKNKEIKVNSTIKHIQKIVGDSNYWWFIKLHRKYYLQKI